MKIRFYALLAFLCCWQVLFSQIQSPYYRSVVQLDNGVNLKGLILDAKQGKVILTPYVNWGRLKGKKKSLAEISPLLRMGRENWVISSVNFDRISSIKLTKMEKNKRWIAPIIGMGVGIVSGFFWGNVKAYFRYREDYDTPENERRKERWKIRGKHTAGHAAVGALIGLTVRMKIHQSQKDKIILTRSADTNWEAALDEYLILK